MSENQETDLPGAMIPHHTAVARLRNVGYDVSPIKSRTTNERIIGLEMKHPLLPLQTLNADCFAYCALDIQLAEHKASEINANALTKEGR